MTEIRRTLIVIGMCLGVAAAFYGQEKSFIEQSLVINVEVPVRVFDGSTFVDDLNIEDFELLEDGIPQKIEAMYLIKKRDITRSDEKKKFVPRTERDFYLIFEIGEYTSRVGDAVRYFIDNVYIPGDQLTIVTPMKTYRFREEAYSYKPKESISEELVGILRRDASQGNFEYKNTVDDIAELARNIRSDVQRKEAGGEGVQGESMEPAIRLVEYAGLLSKLDTIRRVDEMKMLDLANYLKDKLGQKYVFMFYLRKFIPEVEPQLLTQYMNLFNAEDVYIQAAMSGIMDYFRKEDFLNIDRVRQVFADSSTSIHFLHITTPAPIVTDVRFREQSEDSFNAFYEVAQATGGFMDSSSRPEISFKKALDSAENYYLLYYSPRNYVGDGRFKNIEVRIKGQNYRVAHRAGYFEY